MVSQCLQRVTELENEVPELGGITTQPGAPKERKTVAIAEEGKQESAESI